MISMMKLVLLAVCATLAASATTPSPFCPTGCQCVWLDLVCDNAGLTEVPTGQQWSYVWSVFFSGNKISSLTNSTFEGFPKLFSVYLNDNTLSVLDLGAFANSESLTELRVSRNVISTILQPTNGSQLRSLSTLVLSFNQIQSLDPNVFDSTPALTYLSLDGNPLVLPGSRPLLSHPVIAQLALDGVVGSALSSLTLSALPNLQTLTLNSSSVGNLTEGAFASAPGLTSLVLSDNNIPALPANVFYKGARLDVLQVDNNPLQVVEFGALAVLRKGAAFSIADTPLACECGYEPIFRWSSVHGVKLDATCKSGSRCSFKDDDDDSDSDSGSDESKSDSDSSSSSSSSEEDD